MFQTPTSEGLPHFRPPSRDNPGGGGEGPNTADSDTDGGERNVVKKKGAAKKKKKPTNLGPCIRVHEVKPDGDRLEVKAYFETSKNNCVAFEFKTHDLDLDEITTTFVSTLSHA